MLLLTSTSDVITLVTDAVCSVDVHASWVDNALGTITPGRTNTATITTATITTIIGAPGLSTTQRNVKYLIVRNRHATTSVNVTVKHTDGSNNLELFKCALAAGQELQFIDGVGFVLFQTNGATTITSTAVSTNYDPTAVAITGGTMSRVVITAKAGTTGLSGLMLPSGTIESAPGGGEIEYDGHVGYFTGFAGDRGTLMYDQWFNQGAVGRTLVSQTAAQSLFGQGLTANEATLLQFEAFISLSSMSAVSGSFGFAISGTATYNWSRWWSIGLKTATMSTTAAPQTTYNANSLANTTLVTASTSTVGWFYIRGTLRTSAAGTIIPQVSLGQAAAAVVDRESSMRLWKQGTNNQQLVGNWA